MLLTVFSQLHFYVRQHVCYIVRICHANSVRLYVHVSHICIVSKTAERIIEILSLSDSPIILVFRHQGRCVNLTASPLTGAPNTRGVAIFDQYAAISWKRH